MASHIHQDAALPALITEHALAHRWGKSLRTLQRMRAAGTTPRWMRIGAQIHYRVDDVLRHEEALLRAGGTP